MIKMTDAKQIWLSQILHQEDVNEEKRLVPRTPVLTQVTGWVEQAKMRSKDVYDESKLHLQLFKCKLDR